MARAHAFFTFLVYFTKRPKRRALMFDRAPKYALVALVAVAGCAGSGTSPQMMPGVTPAHRDRPAASAGGYSLTDLCPQRVETPCEVGMGGGGGASGFFLFDFGGALNDAGQAAGTSTTESDGTEPTATLFENGKLINLNTLGALFSYGMAINASGQVAGFESDSTIFGDAFLYSNGKMMRH
jgi:hypothetical protein